MKNSNKNSPEEVALDIRSNELPNNDQENLKDEHLPMKTTEKIVIHKVLFKDVFPQIIVGCIAFLTLAQLGINMAYSTILADGLKKDLSLSVDEISWTTSLVTISLPFGSIIVGPLMDIYGRKKICVVSCIPNLISWILLIRANSISIIYVARIIAGISGGLSSVSLVYISEITHPQIRPMVLCFSSIFLSFGILITYGFGVCLTWNQMAIIFLILNIFTIFILLWIPESPYWLVCFGNKNINDRKSQVKIALRRLIKSEEVYEQEYQKMIEVSENHNTNNQKNITFITKFSKFLKQLNEPTVYKPLIILFVLFLLQQLSGTYVIIFYALSMFESMGGKFGRGLDKYDAMVILGIVRFFMSVIASLFSKRFGRCVLCITSGLGMAISMFFSAIYICFTSSDNQNDKIKEVVDEHRWILLFMVLLYVCANCVGLVTIPWTLVSELLPISVRGVMGGFMTSTAYIMMFGMMKSYPYLMLAMGAQGVFFFFSATSLLSACFVYLFVPETLGKSFAEIERYFKNNEN